MCLTEGESELVVPYLSRVAFAAKVDLPCALGVLARLSYSIIGRMTSTIRSGGVCRLVPAGEVLMAPKWHVFEAYGCLRFSARGKLWLLLSLLAHRRHDSWLLVSPLVGVKRTHRVELD